MWMMIPQDEPRYYVLGTGVTHSVAEFCEAAFGYLGLDYKDYVVQDVRFYRPAEVDLLVADSSLAQHKIGWQPRVSFQELVQMMVNADMRRASAGIA